MSIQVLHCPYCQGIDIVKHGLAPEGKQRYRCRTCLEGRGLVRRTICFSKTEQMHDLVIGLFINRYEFGLSL